MGSPSLIRIILWTALAGIGEARAAAIDDPLVELVRQGAVAEGVWMFHGDGAWWPWALASKARGLDPDGDGWGRVMEQVGPELSAGPGPHLVARVSGGLSLGTMVPPYQSGDEEPGLLSPRLSPSVGLRWGGLEALAEAAVGMDLHPGVTAGPVAPRAWVGWRGEHLVAGVGKIDRWLGPGRRGALLLTDNASPPPMGNLMVMGAIPRLEALGRFRAETSMGWMDRPRGDVDRPALLMMDLRWLPAPWLELGASRLSMMGGVGRPWPGLGQILLPTDPHVYGDPDRLEPDQNELAALDIRVSLPLSRWVGGPVDRLEGWWQYGAEDMIAKDLFGIPYPSLAGVANLGGMEVAAGPLSLTGEWARTLDDYFRWYTSHRVYHDGFTQDGRVLGHGSGGDAESLWLRVAWSPPPRRWRGEISWEDVLRVGVVEALGDGLLALAVDERRRRLGGGVWYMAPSGGRLGAGYAVELVTGAGFVPGAREKNHRAWIEYRWQGTGVALGSGGRDGQ